MYYDNDADLGLIKGKTVAVIGFGSQGHAHAQNLRDSGVEVVVSDLPGTPNAERAQKAGFEVLTAAEAAKRGDLIIMLVPDEMQARLYSKRRGRRAQGRQGPHVRPRLQHPLQPDRAAQGRRRDHGRPQGPRPSGPPPVRRGQGRAVADRRPPGRQRQGQGAGAGLRQGHRRHARGRHRDELLRGDRDRPVRRAGRAVRRRQRAHHGRLRHARARRATSPRSPTSSACTSSS